MPSLQKKSHILSVCSPLKRIHMSVCTVGPAEIWVMSQSNEVMDGKDHILRFSASLSVTLLDTYLTLQYLHIDIDVSIRGISNLGNHYRNTIGIATPLRFFLQNSS